MGVMKKLIEKENDEPWKLTKLEELDRYQFGVYSSDSPLGMLVEQGIYTNNIEKMKELLAAQSIDLNKKYLMVDEDWGGVDSLTPVEYVICQLSSGALSVQEAIEMIEVLLKYGAKLDSAVVLDICYHSDEEDRKAMMAYFVSRKDHLSSSLAPICFKEALGGGMNVIERLNYLLQLKAPLSKAEGVFNEGFFYYINNYLDNDQEVLEILQMLQENGYCMREMFDSSRLGRANLL